MKDKQTANTVLMIEPVAFGFNEETAANNIFQKNDAVSPEQIQKQALAEFKTLENKLNRAGIEVITVKDILNPHTPDSIFPNNWISFHEDGTVALYPMYAPNRRKERREDILDILEQKGFIINGIMDYSEAENENIFLEGTGSMVLDRKNKIAYAVLSERTNDELFIEFCEDFEYNPILFCALQNVHGKEIPIYHTNVLMSVGEDFVMVCFSLIKDLKERKLVSDFLRASQKEIIALSEEQINCFAGNALEVEAKDGKRYLVMSNAAYHSLNIGQLSAIERHCKLLATDLSTIEKYGGGSARCMLAEVFLPRK